MESWTEFVNRLKFPKNTVNVGLIGKYVELQDSYKSILEALELLKNIKFNFPIT